jgi:hypothetical protein
MPAPRRPTTTSATSASWGMMSRSSG